MPMKSFLVCSCILFSITSFAQNASIKGSVRDTLNEQNLSNAVIALLYSKDSVLYTFTRSNKDGNFELNNLQSGEYLLMVTSPKFVDYLHPLTLSSDTLVNLGKLSITTKARLLEEVIVQQKIAAIRMRGDTVEFKADSFKVREGASVEELLKRLPGLTVDKDGQITAQGKKVEKVLVDGEEFFGDDPTIATRNLQADAIDKVQVFEKKSDQAAFTGIDDGQGKQTLNLKMKEEKKKGYFGKLDLGGGTDQKWNNSAMINRFRGKQKISGYGIMSSTGTTGLNWRDNSTYGSGDQIEYNDDMGGMVWYGNYDDMGYNGNGLPKSWAAALNYANKYNSDKQSINGSYRFNKLNIEGANNSFTQSILPDTTFFTKSNASSFSSRLRHSANGTYDYQIDSLLSIKVKANGNTGKQQSYNESFSRTSDALDNTINKSQNISTSDGDNQNLNANVILRKKFKKTGRTFSFDLNEQYTANHSTGYLNALITTKDIVTQLPKDSLTDQMKVTDSRLSVFNVKASYTEPLSKKIFAEISYAFRTSNSNSEKLSYNKSPNGKYETLSDTFSNKYKYDVITNTAGLSFKYNTKKITAGIGSSVAFQNFNQEDQFRNVTTKREYVNLFPRANFNYKFNVNSGINISYNGATSQPSINQIQPVADNSNPLIIYVGNPLLKQQFTHRVNFNYNSYKVMSERGLYVYGGFSTISNNIVNSQHTDYATGKTVYQYINTNGNMNGYTGMGYFMKLKKINMNFNVYANMNLSKQTNYVNLLENKTTNYGPRLGFYLSKEKEKKYNIFYNPSVSYNASSSSINTGVNANYWSTSQSLEATVYLKWKLEVNSDINAEFRQKTATFDHNNNVIVWNAYIGRKLLKNDKGLIKISVNDLLNQNKGYNRYINSTMQSESNYETIRRYFMLSFVWNFSKSPMGNTTP